MEGFRAAEGSYLFDQKLLPDYAFKIIRAHPDGSKITRNTSIILLENEREEFHEIRSSITMDDVIGQEDAKIKCRIIMKYLEDPDRFRDWAPGTSSSMEALGQVRPCSQSPLQMN